MIVIIGGMAGKKNQKKGKHAGGRPTKFNEDMVRQAEILGIKGFTDKEIAELFNVREQTIANWKRQYPQFFESLKSGKEIADKCVERTLFERACGYSHPDVHIAADKGRAVITPTIKHYPPDTTACIFWLKNRKPAVWRDKQELEHSGEITVVINKH